MCVCRVDKGRLSISMDIRFRGDKFVHLALLFDFIDAPFKSYSN